ncbi:MAG: hypothetical protein WBD62_04900, partial [Anaerolineales bacterium]
NHRGLAAVRDAYHLRPGHVWAAHVRDLPAVGNGKRVPPEDAQQPVTCKKPPEALGGWAVCQIGAEVTRAHRTKQPAPEDGGRPGQRGAALGGGVRDLYGGSPGIDPDGASGGEGIGWASLRKVEGELRWNAWRDAGHFWR